MQAQLIEERDFYSIIKMVNNEYWVRKNFKVIKKFKTMEEAQNYIAQLKMEGQNNG